MQNIKVVVVLVGEMGMSAREIMKKMTGKMRRLDSENKSSGKKWKQKGKNCIKNKHKCLKLNCNAKYVPLS